MEWIGCFQRRLNYIKQFNLCAFKWSEGNFSLVLWPRIVFWYCQKLYVELKMKSKHYILFLTNIPFHLCFNADQKHITLDRVICFCAD